MSSRILARNAITSRPAATISRSRPLMRAFATAPARLNATGNGNTGGNPSYPAFSLKHISANPRTRFLIGSAIFVLGCIEGATWIKFWPKIMGKDKENTEEQE